MNGRLGPVEMECDAPPYAVVEACAYLGSRRPLDVRWRPARELTGPTAPAARGWAGASGRPCWAGAGAWPAARACRLWAATSSPCAGDGGRVPPGPVPALRDDVPGGRLTTAPPGESGG
jgi:hypothetical protein